MSSNSSPVPDSRRLSSSHPTANELDEQRNDRPPNVARSTSVPGATATSTATVVAGARSSADVDSKAWSKHMESIAAASRNASQQHRKSALTHANARIDDLLAEINDPLMNRSDPHEKLSDGPNTLLHVPKAKARSSRPSISVTDWRPFAPHKDVVSGSVEVIRPSQLKIEAQRDFTRSENSSRKFISHRRPSDELSSLYVHFNCALLLFAVRS
jgi:hypothetical protein